MLIYGSQLNRYHILSLHTAGIVGEVAESLVDPDDLKIVAWVLNGPLLGTGDTGDILMASSVREFSNIGMIIDSTDELVSSGDVVKIDKIRDLNFSLVGLKVVTKRGTNLGKVMDYAVETDTFRVMQLIVKRPALKAFLDPELVVGRSEIVEVDDYTVTVRDEEDKIRKNAETKDFVPNFVNPFREANLAPNHKESPVAKDIE